MMRSQDSEGEGYRVIVRIFAISALALCAGSFVEEARSAQLFVCASGKAIEIEKSELENAKKTNPCVARHFGLKIKTKSAKDATSKLRPVIAVQATEAQVELPVRKPKTAALRETVPSHKKTDKRATTNRIAEVTSGDYRKVRIINAAPGSSKWFNHTR